MWVVKAGIHKMLARIAIREDLNRTLLQKQSDLGLHCFLFLFGRQIVFKVLEHLPYLNVMLYICMYIIKPKMAVLCCTCLCLSLMLLSTSLYP